jgi:pyruvate dehydrogenase E1 component alpha subunit
MDLGHLGANAIVGGGIPSVVGAGLSAKVLGQTGVSVAFFGDGAAQQGILYESLNMAALWKLPCLFVCINNQYGMGTRIDQAAARTDIEQRAIAFGLDGRRVNGTDVEAVRAVAEDLIAGARDGKPGFMLVDCYRFYGHARKDKSPYRDEAEEAAMRVERDAIAFQRQRLTTRGEASAGDLDAIDAQAATEMDGAVDFALAAGKPGADHMFTDVYAPDQPAPEPVDRRIAEVLGR